MIAAGHLVRQGCLSAVDRTLVTDLTGASLTGRELVANVDALAGALLERGLKGSRIGLWYRNSLAAVEAFLAVEWIGGVRLAVDPNAPAGEAEAIFKAAKTDVVLTSSDRADILPDVDVLVHDIGARLAALPAWPALEVEDDQTLVLYPRAVQENGLFAVPISYANWDETLKTSMSLFRSDRYGVWQPDKECFLACQQIMHGTGFVGTFPFLAMGLPQVIADEFQVERIVAAVDQHKVTTTMLVPVMLTRLAAAAERSPDKLACLEHVLYGGGRVELDDLRMAIQVLGPKLSQLYGRFEGGWPLSVLGPEDHSAILVGDDARGRSCGRIINQVEMKLRPTSDNQPNRGEIQVRGPMVVKEYADAEGWCSLGDIMDIDNDGYLSLQGRLDRMINTGYHIYPTEVETAIAAVPKVSDVMVVGETHREWGQTVVAYIVAAPETDGDALVAVIRHHLSSRLARYKIPRLFHIVDKLPKSSS